MIRGRGLSKRFRGRVALEALDLDVAAGEGLVLVGTNGAGRSTLLRILATLLAPTRGELEIAGIDALAEPLRARTVIGYAEPELDFPPGLSAGEILHMTAADLGLPPAESRTSVRELVDRLGLDDPRPAGELSRGMRQRLRAGLALTGSRRVLLLDEPLAGIDPLARGQLLRVLRRRLRDGAALVVATDAPGQLDGLCTRTGYLHAGRLLAVRPTAASGTVGRELARLVAAYARGTAVSGRAAG